MATISLTLTVRCRNFSFGALGPVAEFTVVSCDPPIIQPGGIIALKLPSLPPGTPPPYTPGQEIVIPAPFPIPDVLIPSPQGV